MFKLPARTDTSRGFTLIELVVVLVILSLLTHLAVREMGKVQDGRLARQAERQLEEIRAAVWQTDRGEEPTGFLVDMGRLPRAQATTNETGRTVLTLSELWRRPDDVAPFALRAASTTNLVVPAAVKSELADASVIVPCGWRGPYLRLPTGRDRLIDPWGNPFETPDDAGFVRLFLTNEVAAVAGHPVGAIRHLGADARPDDRQAPATARERDGRIDFLPAGGGTNPLAVNANFVNGNGPVGVSGEVRCRWYLPCGGAITGAVEKTSLAGGSFTTFSFTGVPPGVCTLVVDVGGKACARTRVLLPPGGRSVDLKVWVP